MSDATDKEKCSVDDSQKSEEEIEAESYKMSELNAKGELRDCSTEHKNIKMVNNIVTVAHAIEGVKKDINQKMIQTIRYDNERVTSESPSENTNENSTVESLQDKNYYSRPLPVKIEPVASYFTSWWCGGCFPDHHRCKVCTYYDPDFWNCFLRIVLSILFMMHTVTAGFLFFVSSTPDVAKRFSDNFVLITVTSIVALLMINYFMLCFVAGRCFCMSYFILFAVVAAYSALFAALTARLETNAFLYGILGAAAISSVLFFITFNPCFCFSQWELVLPVAVGVGLMSFFTIHMYLSKFYAQTYPTRDLLLLLAVILLHAVILTFEIRRLLCNSCLDPCCLDYGLGAYLLYTMFLQIMFYWIYVLFCCVRQQYCCMYDYYY